MPSRAREELFRERLAALEQAVDQALAQSGTSPPAGGRVARAVESVLDGYARAARTLEKTSLAAWLPDLARSRVDPGGDASRQALGLDGAAAPLFRLLYRTWWRVETAGLERVPAAGRALLIANHSGGVFAYDAAMLQLALRDVHPAHRWAHPLGDVSVPRVPLLDAFLSRLGAVRGTSERTEALLGDEQLVIAFPEGANATGKLYRRRYRLAHFADAGFVRAALRTGSPVVPVAIVGAEEIHPALWQWDWPSRPLGLPSVPITPTFPWLGALGFIPLPSRWRIEVGTPIDWSGRYGPEAAADQRLVAHLAAGVRRALQRLLTAAVQRRGPAFRL